MYDIFKLRRRPICLLMVFLFLVFVHLVKFKCLDDAHSEGQYLQLVLDSTLFPYAAASVRLYIVPFLRDVADFFKSLAVTEEEQEMVAKESEPSMTEMESEVLVAKVAAMLIEATWHSDQGWQYFQEMMLPQNVGDEAAVVRLSTLVKTHFRLALDVMRCVGEVCDGRLRGLLRQLAAEGVAKQGAVNDLERRAQSLAVVKGVGVGAMLTGGGAAATGAVVTTLTTLGVIASPVAAPLACAVAAAGLVVGGASLNAASRAAVVQRRCALARMEAARDHKTDVCRQIVKVQTDCEVFRCRVARMHETLLDNIQRIEAQFRSESEA